MDIHQMIAEFEALVLRIASITDFMVRKDLLKIAHRAGDIRRAISNEEVNCRRLQRPTSKYNELVNEFEQVLNTLSEYTTLALLLKT